MNTEMENSKMYIVVAVVIVIIIAVWYYLRTPACSPACVLPQTCVTTSGVAACTSPAVPVVPTVAPTVVPTVAPTVVPTVVPTVAPTVAPTVVPACSPACEPSQTCVANVCTATYVKGALSTLPVSYTLGGSLPGNCSNTFMLSSDSNMITTDGSQRYLYTYDVNQNLIKDLSLIPTQAANFACYNNAARELVVTTPLTSVETLTANYS